MLYEAPVFIVLCAADISDVNFLHHRLNSQYIIINVPYNKWIVEQPKCTYFLYFGHQRYTFQYLNDSVKERPSYLGPLNVYL